MPAHDQGDSLFLLVQQRFDCINIVFTGDCTRIGNNVLHEFSDVVPAVPHHEVVSPRAWNISVGIKAKVISHFESLEPIGIPTLVFSQVQVDQGIVTT